MSNLPVSPPEARKRSLLPLIGLVVLCAGAGACGIAGDITPAPPMWGQARQQYEAEQARKREEEAARAPQPGAPAPAPTSPAPAPGSR